ncbi:UDP-N-acetylglucosamine 2-epimerase [Arenicellales bacterium nBUS_45]
MKKICVVTGSRADYGLLYWILKEIENAADLELQLVVTGMHLSSEFGDTVRQIERDGFCISKKVETLLSSDSAIGVTKATGLGLIGFADAFDGLRPDTVVLLGDRFEILAAACAAMFAVIPIAHIHGGEVTVGAFDDAIRHSITKMSSLHFTSTNQYRDRVIQLGENPDTVFNVGAPGIDNLTNLKLVSKKEIENELGISLRGKSLLITFHSVTLEPGSGARDFKHLLEVLSRYTDVQLIFTKSNADTEGRAINALIDSFVESRPSAISCTSLGQLRYLSLLKYVSGMVGNSSSGIIEAPTLGVGTVNIGDRQKGRIRAASVIDCGTNAEDISEAFDQLFSASFQRKLGSVSNPHGSGGASRAIVEILRKVNLIDQKKKIFFDAEHDEQKP